MKEKKEHAGLNEMQRQQRVAGNGTAGSADSVEIRRKKEKVAEQRQRNREIKIQKKTEEYRKLERSYSIRQMTALVVGFLGFFGFAVVMVMSESVLKTTVTEVSSLQSKYEKLVADNNALEASIIYGIDVEEIFRIATEEMGMAYPKKNQVIVYQKSESEHVEQNEDIPKE